MTMQQNVTLIRAISHEFIGHKFKQTVIIFGIVCVIALAIVAYLLSLNAWWWLLAIPVFSTLLLVSLLLMVGKLVLNASRPNITASQATATRNFVDKLEKVAEHVQTPVFIIVFRILLDIVRRPKNHYIQAVAEESASLKPDFIALAKLFK